MRSTELRYLVALSNGTLTDSDEAALLAKVSKGQSKSRARDITEETEKESLEMLALLSDGAREQVRRAISDYTMDSTVINNYLRGAPGAQDESATVNQIDAMFDTYTSFDFDSADRVTYRLASYRPGQIIPYGAAPPSTPAGGAAPTYAPISVGDTVIDLAYVSASENRQLLVQGILNAPAGTRYVKFVIVGGGGINISEGSTYNNQNERNMHHQIPVGVSRVNGIWKRLFTSANAGQAEILYRRGTVFRVNAIQPEGNDVHVKLSILGLTPGVHKNLFDGL